VSITTSLSINGRLFLAPSEHIEALTPLPEQEGPVKGTWHILEMFGSKELAYVITLYDWELFNAVHPVSIFSCYILRSFKNKIK
jgi:Rap guanine nucleotide exchange factor 4